MLLTASASSFARRIRPIKASAASTPGLMDVTDIPKFIRDEIGLSGMAMTTPLLAGCDRDLLAKIVLNADKVGCPCLTLIEPDPLPLQEETQAQASEERIKRIVQAGQWLGCSSISIRVTAPDDEDFMLEVAERLRPLIRKAEKMDINVCIGSAPGLTANPDRVTELLKKIGGFRVGTLPDFASACKSGDAAAYLRRLVPYASTVLATVGELNDGDGKTTPGAATAPKPKGKKAKDAKGDDSAAEVKPAGKALGLADCVSVVEAVGFDGSLALDYSGTGDATGAIIKAKEIVQRLLGGPAAVVDELDLDAVLGAVGDDPEIAEAVEPDDDDDDAEIEPVVEPVVEVEKPKPKKSAKPSKPAAPSKKG